MQSENDEVVDYFAWQRPEIVERISAHIREMLASRSGISVLDVGCASGKFGAALINTFGRVQVDGVEMDENAARLASKSLRRVFVQEFDENLLDVVDDHYDIIFFNDSFEHMMDSEGTLRIAKKMAHEHSLFVFSIPNIRHFRVLYDLIFRKDWKYVEAGILDRTHLRFFTEKSFLRLLAGHGLSPVSIFGLNTSKKPVYRAVFLFFDLLTFWRHKDIKYRQFLVIAQSQPGLKTAD